MRIERNFEDNGNILPSIFNLINSIPEEQIFSQNYFLRDPKIILNRSFKRIFSAFDNLIKLENRIEEAFILKKDLSEYNFDNLSMSIMELLESINSFIEDCQHIFKSTTPPSILNDKIQENFVSNWLKKTKHPTHKTFFELIKDYKEEIAYYINNYKHEHGRIDIILGNHENDFTIGFTMKFIGQTPDGNIEILDLKKVKTLRLEICYHFFQFYRISEIFTEQLIKAQKFFHGLNIKILKKEANQFDVKKIIKHLQYNDLLVFPNNDLFIPKVYLHLTPTSLLIEYPFGITESNTKYIKQFKIEGKSFPENSVLLIPTNQTIESFFNQKRKIGDKLEISVDDKKNFQKIFLTHKTDNETYSFIEVNYDNIFKIKSSTNIQMALQGESFIESKLHVKIFEIDYLGIKMTKSD